MNTISASTKTVMGYGPMARSCRVTVVENQSPRVSASRFKSVGLTELVQQQARSSRTESLCFMILTGCAVISLAIGLPLLPALVRALPAVESTLNSLLK